jgi:capsular exopolysaccharide synthesis family protein
MGLNDVLFVLRRHRALLFVAVLVGLAAGWITAPGAGADPPQFEATNVLIVNPERNSGVNLDQAALRAATTAVATRAGEVLGEEPETVLSRVSASADLEAAAVRITGHAGDPEVAEATADAVAEALLAELTGDSTESYEEQVSSLNARAQELRDQLADADDASDAEVAVVQTELGQTLQELNAVTRDGPPRAAEEGLAAPASKPARALLLGAFGLLGGLACVFALDRLDTRIHTKRQAEDAFGHPVIAEVPRLPRGSEPREFLAASRPGSHFVEAFRGLRAHVTLADEGHGMRPRAPGAGAVVLVTSPLAGEGKTTTTAHLAAMLAEVGRSVVIVSADFRRPRIHELLGRERGPGLTEVLSGGPKAPDVADLDLSTRIKDVNFLASGAPAKNPSVVVKRVASVLDAARSHWDFVVVDSAPLLVANDSADLARAADGVVLVVRAGRTTVEAAKRTAELLGRIEASVLGLVLVGAEETPTAYRYYRRSYYSDDWDLSWWDRRRRRTAPGTARRNGSSPARSASSPDRPVGSRTR